MFQTFFCFLFFFSWHIVLHWGSHGSWSGVHVGLRLFFSLLCFYYYHYYLPFSYFFLSQCFYLFFTIFVLGLAESHELASTFLFFNFILFLFFSPLRCVVGYVSSLYMVKMNNIVDKKKSCNQLVNSFFIIEIWNKGKFVTYSTIYLFSYSYLLWIICIFCLSKKNAIFENKYVLHMNLYRRTFSPCYNWI